MRPIDADTLKKSIERLCEDERTNMTAITYFALHDLLDTMPTVKAEPDNGWISVNDRLPEEHENVLTYGARPFYDVVYVNRLIDKKNGEWLYDGVTHWMPLPQKPESEDNAK